MKWGDLKTIKFIRLYKEHPCLWDIKSPDYKNRRERNVAYAEIIKRMNTPNFGHRECQNKIKNIRSQYCQELKKIRVSRKIGGLVYKPTLLWFDILHNFLKDIVVHRERPNPIGEQVTLQERDDTTSDIEFLDYTIIKEESDDTECESIPEEHIEVTPNQTLDVSTSNAYEEYDAGDSKSKENDRVQQLTSAVQKIENILANNSTMTEFDVFGQSVAAQLKNMPFDDALRLQLEIQQLITLKRIKNRLTQQ